VVKKTSGKRVRYFREKNIDCNERLDFSNIVSRKIN
jgi:hypothetical protein